MPVPMPLTRWFLKFAEFVINAFYGLFYLIEGSGSFSIPALSGWGPQPDHSKRQSANKYQKRHLGRNSTTP